jgi:hypothetical protein
MPATAKGIYHNLRESKYRTFNGEVLFYFSSELYRNKFIEGYILNRKLFNRKLEETPLNMDVLADVLFYQKIEKRGFFVRLERARITFDDLYKYAFRKMNEKISPDWVVK